MLADDTRDYLLSKNATSEEALLGPDVLVHKIGGKMFAILASAMESDGASSLTTGLASPM